MTDSKSKLVIATVGTSLIEKLGAEKIEINHTSQKNVLLNSSLYKNIKRNKNISVDKAEKYYVKSCNDVGDAMDKLIALDGSILSHFSFAPAEIASLWKLNLNRDNDKVLLLYSDTPLGVFCHRVLSSYIDHNIASIIHFTDVTEFSSDTDRIDGLQPDDVDKFKNEGLHNLLQKLAAVIEQKQNEYHIILNITGGYKGLVPYSSLFSMCFEDIDMVYLYEESKDLVWFDKLPIDFDVLYWNDHRSLVRILESGSAAIPVGSKKVIRDSLSKKFRNLFDEGGAITPVGKFVKDRLETQMQSLSYYGSGRVLSELIKDDTLRAELETWLENSQHIWHGDLLAETVEHARGHAQRLQEMAFQILKPIFDHEDQNGKNRTLYDKEIAVLAYTLWIHDIGHSGRTVNLCDNDGKEFSDNDKFPVDISPFPSLVRDLHHYSAYLMLTNDEESQQYFPPELFNSVDNAKSYAHAVAVCYLYHRGKMNILNEIKTDKPIFESAINMREFFKLPLIKFMEKYHNNILKSFTIEERRLKWELIVAIQRLVDGADVQKERTWGTELEKRKDWLRKREIVFEMNRLNILIDAIKNHEELKNNRKYINWFKSVHDDEWLDNFKKILPSKWNENEGKPELSVWQRNFENDGIENDGDSLYALLHEIWEKRKINKYQTLDTLFEEYLSCLDKIVWKHTSPPHFVKHSSVDSIFFTTVDPFPLNGDYRFQIHIIVNEMIKDEVDVDIQLNTICWDIKDEYKKGGVEKIFEENNIYFVGFVSHHEGKNKYASMDAIKRKEKVITIEWVDYCPWEFKQNNENNYG